MSQCTPEFFAQEYNYGNLVVAVSVAVFLALQATYLNHFHLFTLNYFMEWILPHVIITMTVAPCTDKVCNFLNQMTYPVS